MAVLHIGILLQIKHSRIYNEDDSLLGGVHSGSWFRHCATSRKVTGLIHWDFSLMYIILLTALWPWGWLSL